MQGRALISRRGLLKGLAALQLVPLAVLWQQATTWRARVARAPSRVLPVPTVDGITRHDTVLLRREGATITALSARCPHLGCVIDQVEGDTLVCPCHGSRFNLEGALLQGPAGADLTRLEVRWEVGDDTLLVETG